MSSRINVRSATRRNEPKAVVEEETEPPRILKEREIINIFMACGIMEHVAKDIIRGCPELKDLTDKISEDFKAVLRESLNILDKEGVPKVVIEEHTDGSDRPKAKIAICRICSDSGALRARYPDKMGKWFRINQGFKGKIRKEDWLCKGCFGEWYRDCREWVEAGAQEAGEDTEAVEEEDDGAPKAPKKEYYIKTIVNLLFLMVKNLPANSITHRKMLLRYITMNQLELNQLPTAIYYLRKAGTGIIDQEEFEKSCGIGRYADLFGFSSWDKKHTEREILRIGEQERIHKKKEEQLMQAKMEEERRKKEEDDKKEAERQKQLQDQLLKAEKDIAENLKADKLKKLADARKKEDEEIAEARKKADQLKAKLKEKKEAEKKAKAREREQDLKDLEYSIKTKGEDLRRIREERFRQQRAEMQSRAADRRNQIKEMELQVTSSRLSSTNTDK